MAKQGFTRNKAAIKAILATPKPEQIAAAERVLQEADTPEAEIVHYTTDRAVVGVQVPFEDQALHGTATRAAGRAGLRPGRP
jgi:hypothetical protein